MLGGNQLRDVRLLAETKIVSKNHNTYKLNEEHMSSVFYSTVFMSWLMNL